MKKILLAFFSIVTIAAGGSLISAQTTEPQPCKPVPAGCKLIKGCSCDPRTGVCEDVIQCPGQT